MSTPVTTSLNAWRAVSQQDRVRVHRRGRICAQPGCDTILSVYNPAKYCSAHVQESQSSRRRRLAAVPREVACEHCGSPFATTNEHRKYCSDRCRMAAFARRKRAAERAVRRLDQRAAEPSEVQGQHLVEDAA